ncbi:MAG: hypothetical protein LUD68_03325 [Rikenellaceae bacterium]|nr:hypothetical protein [Rikenellaceae bacterium]
MKKLFLMMMLALPVIGLTAWSSSNDDPDPDPDPEPVKTLTLAEIAEGVYTVDVEVTPIVSEASVRADGDYDQDTEKSVVTISTIGESENTVKLEMTQFEYFVVTATDIVIDELTLTAVENDENSAVIEDQTVKVSLVLSGQAMEIDDTTISGTIAIDEDEVRTLDLKLSLGEIGFTVDIEGSTK